MDVDRGNTDDTSAGSPALWEQAGYELQKWPAEGMRNTASRKRETKKNPCTSVPPWDWQLLQWNTGLQALPGGIKPPPIPIQFVAAGLQTRAFTEKDKRFGIGILQDAHEGSVLYLGDWSCFLAWRSVQNTHSSASSSRVVPRQRTCAEDETHHANPESRPPTEAHSLTHVLLPPHAPAVIGLERDLWMAGGLCFFFFYFEG